MFWDKQAETLKRGKLEALQIKQFNKTLDWAKQSLYYKEKLKDSIPSISKLEDIKRFPFTAKQDLRDNFPYGFLAVSLDDSVRLHSSSGTTGIPTVVFHTPEDIDHWAGLVARCLYMAGMRKDDVFQNMMGYGLFTGGLGLHYGSEKLGALTIPFGPGNSKRQIWFMKTFGTTAVHILPSYAFRLHSFFAGEGVDPVKDLKLRVAIIGAEPHTEGMRKQIEKLYQIKAYNSYGLSEMCGPGVALECEQQQGMHLWEDHYYMEIIDPATGEVLPDGQEGELVLTTLQRRAMPLIRYRTRDLTRIIPAECACGRTHRRIERIKGRDDDMLIINGVNIFPMQIEQTIMKYDEVQSHYLIEITKEDFLDKVHVKVEVHEGLFTESFSALEKLQKHITADLKSELGVNPKVHLVEPGSLPVTEGKAKRVYDLR